MKRVEVTDFGHAFEVLREFRDAGMSEWLAGRPWLIRNNRWNEAP